MAAGPFPQPLLPLITTNLDAAGVRDNVINHLFLESKPAKPSWAAIRQAKGGLAHVGLEAGSARLF